MTFLVPLVSVKLPSLFVSSLPFWTAFSVTEKARGVDLMGELGQRKSGYSSGLGGQQVLAGSHLEMLHDEKCVRILTSQYNCFKESALLGFKLIGNLRYCPPSR